jgi:hypothetical protein
MIRIAKKVKSKRTHFRVFLLNTDLIFFIIRDIDLYFSSAGFLGKINEARILINKIAAIIINEWIVLNPKDFRYSVKSILSPINKSKADNPTLK